MTEKDYEQYTRDWAEARSEYNRALLAEIAKGTETNAELRRQLAETRIPAHILSDLSRAQENFEAARSAMEARAVTAAEKAADAHLRNSAWATEYKKG